MTDTLREEEEAWRVRDLSPESGADLFIATGDERLRRWGAKTGVLCVGAMSEEGRKGFLSLSTAINREREESCLEVVRGLAKRGMPVPETSATEGARGLTTAIEATWPKSFRIRCGFPTMQNLPQKVPAQLCSEVNALLVDRRDAPTPAKAEKRREAIVEQSPREWPEACRCLLDEAQASLNHLLVPQRHQRYGRPSHLVARAFVEERCRTKVIPHL